MNAQPAMTIACIGGGPAGLFLSNLLKKHRPDWRVAVYEQNPRGNTFGWGGVFSDGTMENLRAAAELGYTEQWWPPQYLSGKRQFERLAERRREAED